MSSYKLEHLKPILAEPYIGKRKPLVRYSSSRLGMYAKVTPAALKVFPQSYSG